jgi:amino acid transporter
VSTPLRRQLTLLDCFGIGINGIIGSGIFFLPATLYRLAGGQAPLAWLIVGGLCALVALCFAEAASRTDRSGGPYRYACDAFGPYVGFAVGWVTLISSLLGYTAVARGFGQTAAVVLHCQGQAQVELALSLGVVTFLCIVNVIGVRPGARTGDILSFVKIGSLLLFVGVGLFFVDFSHFSAPPRPAAGEHGGLLAAAFAGLFATTGFEYVPVPAGEAKNPQRAVPLAMVVSVLGATVLYLVIQVVADGTHPGLWQSRAALADSAGAFGGARGRFLLGLAGTISAFGFCAGSALVGPRYLEAFAQDRFLPGALAYRSPRLGTPVWAVCTLSVLVVLLLLFPLRFESLASISNVAVVVQYMATCTAVLVLRQKGPPPPGAFVIPLGPLVPLLALLGSSAFLLYVGQMELYVAGAFILFGLVIGTAYRGRASL